MTKFSLYTPDPTGADPDYALSPPIIETFYRTGQVVDFGTPLFADTLSIVVIGVGGQTLKLGSDYTIDPSNYDDTAMSKALNVDSTFNRTLIKSITVARATGLLPVQVQISGQQYFLTDPNYPVTAADGAPNFTPDMLDSILNQLASLSENQATITDQTAVTLATPTLLDYDINGVNDKNALTGENHEVNTYQGKNYIRPVNGAFFRDSVAVFNGDQELTPGVDFTVASCDLALTAASTNKSGVYNLIHVIADISDTLSVNAHYVGGTATVAALGALYTGQTSIVQYLTGSKFLTENSLKTSGTIQTILRSLNSLNTGLNTMRQLTANPSYGDSTNSTAVVKAIRATDYNLHWYTVASLYQIENNPSTVIKADRMKLRVRLDGAKYQCDLDVSVDLDNTRNPVTITASNVIWDAGMTLYGPISTIAPMVPMARVISRKTTGGVSGALLQVGFVLAGLTDRLALEDYSGVESAWILDRTTGNGSAILPSDQNVTLPDGSVWSASDTLCVQNVQTLQARDGLFLYGGTTQFSSFDSSATTQMTPIPVYAPSYIQASDIVAIDAYVTNAQGARFVYRLNAELSGDGNTLTANGIVALDSTTDNLGLMMVSVNIKDWTITPQIRGLSSITDQFALRYLVARVAG